MSDHYTHYRWKNGIPFGSGKLSEQNRGQGRSFRILMDPYRKHISIEAYQEGRFEKVVYDSHLLNFRHLTPTTQLAWHRELIVDSPAQTISLLRDQDDRIICQEKCDFVQHLCRKCTLTSPHGILLSTHEMSYTFLKDPENCVILFDSERQPVMIKKYKADETTGEFLELIEENWEIT